jgi:TPR repeat protein
MKPLSVLVLSLGLLVFGSTVVSAADSPEVAALRRKAEAADADSQLNLELRYDDGEGVPKDSAEAIKWYRKAADLLQAHAWYNVSVASGNEVARPVLEIVEKQMKADQVAKAMEFARDLFAKIEANKAGK